MRKSPTDTRPERRPLRIFAFDPMLARTGDHRVTVEIPYRNLECQARYFHDDRLEIVDYDAAARRYFRAVNLNHDEIAMTQGLEPLEHDPQFHQQMVYAVASKVLENFDKALGRRFRPKGGDRLRLFPHAFQARNAYFDSELNAVLFGYFPADEDDPGANLPGQLVFTCLSHDVVAHEVAHAALSRLRPYYSEPTNPQVPALHEAFADIVAMFQRMTFPEVVSAAIRECRGDLMDPSNRLLDLGAQFGAAAGKGGPLRRITASPDPTLFARTNEPHDLGWILVSAVYEGFVSTYLRRTRDLVRIATGGSGRLPEGELHPDLVNRLSTECVRTAQAVLSMCIRATDYMPPVDPTFSDFLRAMITADFELTRSDDTGLRAAMIEAFRKRGIRPESVGSLAVQSLLLEAADDAPPDPRLAYIVSRLLKFGAQQLDRNATPARVSTERKRRVPSKLEDPSQWVFQQNSALFAPYEEEGAAEAERVEDDEPEAILRHIGKALHAWAIRNRERLGLDAELPVQVSGFHPVHRIAPNGELIVEMVAQFVQTKRTSDDFGGLRYRAGVTLIAGIEGNIRYLIAKPFHARRLDRMREWVSAFDGANGPTWPSDSPPPDRITEAFSARAMDRRRWR